MKHIQLRHMFVKGLIRKGAVEVQRLPRDCTPANALTKPLDEKRMAKCLQLAGSWELVDYKGDGRKCKGLVMEEETMDTEIALVEIDGQEDKVTMAVTWMYHKNCDYVGKIIITAIIGVISFTIWFGWKIGRC